MIPSCCNSFWCFYLGVQVPVHPSERYFDVSKTGSKGILRRVEWMNWYVRTGHRNAGFRILLIQLRKHGLRSAEQR